MIPRFPVLKVAPLVMALVLLAACQPIEPESFVTPTPTPIVVAKTPTPVPAAGVPRPSNIDPASLAGEWKGTLQSVISTRVLLEQVYDEWYGSIEIGGLNSGRKPLGRILVNPPSVSFVMDSGASFATTFEGVLGDDGILRGNATGDGQVLSFELQQTSNSDGGGSDTVTEEVRVLGGATSYTGTITKPSGEGAFPAILLLGDFLPQNRDGETLLPPGNAPLRRIAEALTSAGYLVLRLDDRGTGDSSGEYFFADYADLARDARSAIAFLLKRNDVRSDAVGIVGYGEGATVSANAFDGSSGIAFLAALSAPGLPGVEYLQNMVREEGEALEMHPDRVEGMLDLLAKMVDATQNGPTALVSLYLPLFIDRWNDVAQLVPTSADAGGKVVVLAPQWGLSGIGSRHDLDVWATDPVEVWSDITIPVLLVAGDLDRQASPAENQGRIADALEAGGNLNVSTVVVPGMNHLLLEAESGSIAEYPELSPELSEELLLVLVEWLDQTVAAIEE